MLEEIVDMRLVPVKRLKENSEVAINIIDNNGKLMLKEGQKITSKGIEILEKLGITYVYINDEYCFNNKHSKYTMKIDYLYKSIIELEDIAKKVIRGEAGSKELSDARLIATQFVDDVILAKDSLKISYEPNKLIVNSIVEQTIYVAIMAVILGVKMELSRENLIKLCIAALLKDIALVSPNVKNSGNYGYKEHPRIGYEYLKKNYALDKEILQAILHHHERVDGSGYPNKLKGEEISSFAGIISIVDSFYEIKINHAMLDKDERVFEEKLKKILIGFDMVIVGYFLKHVEVFTLDTMVILNNGDIGIIIKNNTKNPFKPSIKIIKSNYKLEGEIIDFYDNRNLYIKYITYYVEE